MGWRLLEKEKAQRATRKLVTEFAEMPPCPKDRALNPRRVKWLLDVITAGQLRSPHWASVHCLEVDQTFRVNGKHTSQALTILEDGIPEGLDVLVSRYEADTMEDVGALYASFDSKQSARTAADIYMVFAGGVPELAELPRHTIQLAVQGLAWDCWETQSTMGHTAEERAHLLLEYPKFGLFVSSIISSRDADSKHLRRGPVAAAMARTWHRHQEGAGLFWTMVKTGCHPDHNNPTRKLEKLLLKVSVNKGAGSRVARSERHMITERELATKSLHSWNAWCRGETTAMQYFAQADVPKAASPRPDVIAEAWKVIEKLQGKREEGAA